MPLAQLGAPMQQFTPSDADSHIWTPRDRAEVIVRIRHGLHYARRGPSCLLGRPGEAWLAGVVHAPRTVAGAHRVRPGGSDHLACGGRFPMGCSTTISRTRKTCSPALCWHTSVRSCLRRRGCPSPAPVRWPFDVNSLRRMGEAFGGHLHKPTPLAAANSTSPPQAYQARHTLPADQRFTFRQADRTVAGIGSAGPLLIRVSPPSSGTGHRQLSGCADVT
jgi:hypothetical protein